MNLWSWLQSVAVFQQLRFMLGKKPFYGFIFTISTRYPVTVLFYFTASYFRNKARFGRTSIFVYFAFYDTKILFYIEHFLLTLPLLEA